MAATNITSDHTRNIHTPKVPQTTTISDSTPRCRIRKPSKLCQRKCVARPPANMPISQIDNGQFEPML
jgi:hypothetical protein